MPALGTVYLIPTFLHEEALETIPAYMLENIKKCQVIFSENEKMTRRYFRKLNPFIVIEKFEWYATHKAEMEVQTDFKKHLLAGKNIGIISDAGCPCIADPGQILVALSHKMGAVIKPLVGPSSILLALMASGMNGQQFQFNGYLPIDNIERKTAIKNLDAYSAKNNTTQIFIETPYRNNHLIKELLMHCKPSTMLCIAVDITSPTESIITKTIEQWKATPIDIHKRLAIFLILAGVSKFNDGLIEV